MMLRRNKSGARNAALRCACYYYHHHRHCIIARVANACKAAERKLNQPSNQPDPSSHLGSRLSGMIFLLSAPRNGEGKLLRADFNNMSSCHRAEEEFPGCLPSLFLPLLFYCYCMKSELLACLLAALYCMQKGEAEERAARKVAEFFPP